MPAEMASLPAYVPPRLPSPLAVANQSKPIVRAQSDNGATPVRIPTPEELGLAGKMPIATDAPLDWTAVENKLDSAGVSSYQMERTANGFRFTCKLASRSIVGNGTNRADAVRQALAQIH